MPPIVAPSSSSTVTLFYAKVLFLNQRPQSRPFRGSGNVCTICDRSLQDPYLFCSVPCKVHHLVRTEGGLLKYLYECEFLPLPEGVKGESCDLDDGQLTPESVLESPDSLRTSSGSSASGGAVDCKTLACTATTEIVKKKRSSATSPRMSYGPTCLCVSEISISLNRRKSLPHRSPLY
ncbi:hypothetical protein NE237_029482 [Protea cynaroides]|uniref:PLATZ transcription factor family protein n=1 Tax=Protea cynaroides TaxID=273540 RepID=A0A9Q0GSD8_9MAGN|nr:hypothetical protein NE237_029482 [Protea cynaroides]